jgi:multidrug efflux pump
VRDIGARRARLRNYDLAGRLNGKAVAPMLLYLRPGANALAAKEAVRSGSTSCRATSRRASRYDSVRHHAVRHGVDRRGRDTLVEAMLLVALVVFVFLQSWRATLIPMLAVPVSVIGTFLGLSCWASRSTC